MKIRHLAQSIGLAAVIASCATVKPYTFHPDPYSEEDRRQYGNIFFRDTAGKINFYKTHYHYDKQILFDGPHSKELEDSVRAYKQPRNIQQAIDNTIIFIITRELPPNVSQHTSYKLLGWDGRPVIYLNVPDIINNAEEEYKNQFYPILKLAFLHEMLHGGYFWLLKPIEKMQFEKLYRNGLRLNVLEWFDEDQYVPCLTCGHPKDSDVELFASVALLVNQGLEKRLEDTHFREANQEQKDAVNSILNFVRKFPFVQSEK